MRCKRHTVDFSSSIGVCASCLRERLFSLAASTAASEDNNNHHHRRVSTPPRPLVFPRSVSPYVSARKSDAGRGGGGDSSLASFHNRFFTTPQVGSTGGGDSSSSENVFDSGRSFKKKQSRLSRFSSLFRTRSDEFRYSYDATTSSPPSSSRSWLSKVLSVRSKKPCYIEDLIASESSHPQTRPRQRYCRGMSPAGDSESVEESPGRVKRTPAAMGTPGRRKTAMISTGMGFCLSPLVRAKPNRSSNWKGKLPPEFGELKSPARPHISTAASFCANRSKKLVDLGRVDPRR